MVWVVGGGPAGVSAAVYARRGGLEVSLIYQPGSSALDKAEQIDNLYGSAPISGRDLLEQGLAQARNLGVEVMEAQALALGWGESALELTTNLGTHPAQAVILATGAPRLAPKLPGLREYEGKGVSYCAVCDGFFCRGKAAAILGNGAFACHEAAVLLPLASSVTLLTNGESAPEEVPEGVVVETRKVASLEGGDLLERVRLEDGTILEIPRLFVALGTAGSGDLARQAGAVVNGSHIAVDDSMATNVPGLFAAGDCTGGLMQVVKAAHEGAVAGMSAVKFCRGA